MGDILCTVRKKGPEDINPLINVSILELDGDVSINSKKQTQNPSSVGTSEVNYLINGKKRKSMKKEEKNIRTRSQGKKVGKKGFTDKPADLIISNNAVVDEIKKQFAQGNKSNKKLPRNGDKKVNNEDSTQSLSTIRSLSRSSDMDTEEDESAGDRENSGTDVDTDEDAIDESTDEDSDDNENDTEEEDADIDEADEEETDEDDSDEDDSEEDDTTEGEVDRDIQESDNAADEKRKRFRGILNKKLRSATSLIRHKSFNKLHLQPSPSKVVDDTEEGAAKPILLFNIGTGMTAQSIKEILPTNNGTLLNSTEKQTDPTESNNVPAKEKETDETDETQLTNSLKKDTFSNKNRASF